MKTKRPSLSAKEKSQKETKKQLRDLEDWNFAPKKKKSGASFYDRVYAIVEQIPKGMVTTYGAIAETLGMKGSSRLVGQALGAIPEGWDIPAHRVINRIGALSGAHKFGGYESMRSLLVKEGVPFKGELVNIKSCFWHPDSLKRT